jgi:hypothetical protein
MSHLLKDDKGNWSSTRVVLILSFFLLLWMFLEWRVAFRIEILKEVPDYGGLTQLFIAMLVTFGLALIGKVVQKKYEENGTNDQ